MDILFVLIAVSPAVIMAKYDLKGKEMLWKTFLPKVAGWFYGITFINFMALYLQGMGEFDFTVLSLQFLSGYMLNSIAVILLVQTGRRVWRQGLLKKRTKEDGGGCDV